MTHRLSKTFGKSRVTTEQREELVRGIFNRVAGRYDLMNDLMSMGIHRVWKHRFCKEVNKTPGHVFVDLAGGTGDIASAMINDQREVIIIDPSVEMMRVAEKHLGQTMHVVI